MNKQWTERLRERWKLKSIWEVIIVLIVFACTGFTVLYIKRPLLHLLAGDSASSLSATIIYYILILPVYNIILLLYGFILGQFSFFWEFEKRFFKRIAGWMTKRK